MKHNATFHAFKQSGKWYSSDRGNLSADTYTVWETQERRDKILQANDGKYPGLNGTGSNFIFVVIPDEDAEHGYPLMLKPE
jgi:hypothetical protein